tara:strand:+ start:1765 stop:2292 length:528 start_codon:yes stop_codon:yes gene_type:complete
MHYKLIKKYYFIDKFNKKNIDSVDANTSIIYRNYSKKVDINIIIKIRDYCKKKKLKFFISNNFKLAISLGLDGAYIPSFNKDFRHLSYSLKKKFKIIGSAHNIFEIELKNLQNVNEIFLSSLFKKNKNYLGPNRFKIIKNLTNKKIIALGGISKKNFKNFKLLDCSGFAGISFFE